MENYRISQNPGSAKKPSKKKASRAPKRKSSQSTNPALILAVVVAALVLILGGVYIVTKNSKKEGASTGTAAKQPGVKGTPGVIPAQAFTDVTNAISNKQTQNINRYYAKKVKVVATRKSINRTVNGSEVDALIAGILNGAQTPWDWHVNPSDLSAWQTGPNGQYFTGNVLVGISQDGTVISIAFDENGEITTVFIAPVGDLTTSTGGTGSTSTTPSTGNTGSTGSDGTTAPTTPDDTQSAD